MKKIILLLCAAFCGVFSVAAQDLIVKTDATKVEAKVTEVTPDAVRYKRFSNPDGPTYVVPVAEIDYIQYANGEKEQFKQSAAIPATPLTPAQSVAKTETTPAKFGYAVGDLYEQDGLKGVVCVVYEGGQHGLIVSLDEIYLPWDSAKKSDLREVKFDDHKDGAVNMEKAAAYIAANNLSWDNFPAFKWCREKGEGWYLPAIDELLVIGHNYNGGMRVSAKNRQARNTFNNTLKENGGERMDRMVYYFSSTEMDEKNAFTSHMNIEPPYVIEIPKNNKFLVRAVHKF